MDNIKNLLQSVSLIQKKYDDIAEITGENFNVFSVLKMDSNEVRMHSAFIGELLKLKGSHGLKEKPFEIFIDLLNSKFNKADTKEVETKFNENKFKIDTQSAFTTVEKYIGFTNEDKTEGGRIDIIVEDKNKKAIIIENKIYAIEQTNQLIRYNNYLKDAPILYLTLYGSAPTSHGELKENIDYFNISYKEDIKKWLELCIKETVDKPMLREVIKQYIYLIKKLTGQTINKEMSIEIADSMKKNIKSSFEIYNNLNTMKRVLILDFIKELKNQLKDNYIINCSENQIGDKGSSITIKNESWRDSELLIFFNGPFSDILLGFDKETENKKNDPILRNKFQEVFKNGNNFGKKWDLANWNILYRYDKFSNIDTEFFWVNLNSQDFVRLICDDIKLMNNKINLILEPSK